MKLPHCFRLTDWDVLEDRVLPSQAAVTVPTVVPVERLDAYAQPRHAQDLQQAAQGTANVVFLGDSITDFWGDSTRAGVGQAVWNQAIAPLGAANFGVSGDTAENLLWRVENGELAGQPKVVVVEIGTNDLGLGDSVAQTTAAVTAVVSAIRAASPQSTILLQGIFPRGHGLSDPLTQEALVVNASLAKLADGTHVDYIDPGANFLTPLGTLSPGLFLDRLHPSARGYQVWANAIVPTLNSLLPRSSTGSTSSTSSTSPVTPAPKTPVVVSPPPGSVTRTRSPVTPASTVVVSNSSSAPLAIAPASTADGATTSSPFDLTGGTTTQKKSQAAAWPWVLPSPTDAVTTSV
jgi:lysophospholipase L1-like esterase